MIYVDDAHGTGVIGKNGAGVLSHFGIVSDRIIHMGTLSKAYGSIGGFIAANKDLVDLLRFVCSGYIFTSTIPQDQAYAIIAAINAIKENPSLIASLWSNQKYFVEKMRALPYQLVSIVSPIVPILIGDEKLADKFTAIIHENGMHVDSVKFPSVPYGKARLRVILNAHHTKEQIDKLVAVLEKNKGLLQL
jgi:7-keto-8-aminopelargonate synthetase-like enzyme